MRFTIVLYKLIIPYYFNKISPCTITVITKLPQYDLITPIFDIVFAKSKFAFVKATNVKGLLFNVISTKYLSHYSVIFSNCHIWPVLSIQSYTTGTFYQFACHIEHISRSSGIKNFTLFLIGRLCCFLCISIETHYLLLF